MEGGEGMAYPKIDLIGPPWIYKLKAGDVLKSPSGLMRVIRRVDTGKTKRKVWVTFAIQHCSWTHKAYTVYNMGELLELGYRRTNAKVSLRGRMDKMLAQDINNGTRNLTCCDIGLLS